MEYKIEKRSNNELLVLKLSDDITVYQIGRFKEALQAIKNENSQKKRVIIDFKDVGHIDELAFGTLTSFSKEIIENGGDVKITCVNDDIKLLFDSTRLSKVYEIYDSVEEAEKNFK